MTILLLLVNAHLPVPAVLRACSEPIVLLLLFCCSLYKSITHSHTRLDPGESPSRAQPQSTGYWCNLCSDRDFSLTHHSWFHYFSHLVWLSNPSVFFSFLSLSFFSYSILWGNDKKCHLWSHRLSWFPWQLQQQSDMPLGPGGPWRPTASHPLWEGGSGRGRWQVVYAHC